MSAGQVLVAGGAGFLGSHLCRRLLAQGQGVLCLDNFSTGQPRNLVALRAHPRFSCCDHDIVQPLPGAILDAPLTAVYNLACPASPAKYQRDPLQTWRTCVLGTDQLLALAHRAGVPFLQASTSEVYGDPEVTPQAETYRGNVNPCGPRACYDEGKRAAEALICDYARQHGLVVRVARIFNTYGPGMAADDGRVVSNFMVQALRGQPLTLHGDGTQVRAFCYVDDLMAGLEALMRAPTDFTGPVNLGNPEPIAMQPLAHQVLALVGRDLPLVFLPRPTDDPRQRCPDIRLAQQQLGWQPRVPLAQGLAATLAYFRALLAL